MRAHYFVTAIAAGLWLCPLGAIPQTPAQPPVAAVQTPHHSSNLQFVTTASLKGLTALLDLTPAQVASISQIRNDYRQATKPLIPPPGTPFSPDTQGKIAELRQKEQADILAALTPAQKDRLADSLTEIRALAYDGINPSAIVELKLTDDQLKQLEQIYADSRKKAAALGRDARKDQTQPIMDDARAHAAQILTPAQQAILEKYRAPRKASPAGSAPRQ